MGCEVTDSTVIPFLVTPIRGDTLSMQYCPLFGNRPGLSPHHRKHPCQRRACTVASTTTRTSPPSAILMRAGAVALVYLGASPTTGTNPASVSAGVQSGRRHLTSALPVPGRVGPASGHHVHQYGEDYERCSVCKSNAGMCFQEHDCKLPIQGHRDFRCHRGAQLLSP